MLLEWQLNININYLYLIEILIDYKNRIFKLKDLLRFIHIHLKLNTLIIFLNDYLTKYIL